MFIPRRRFTEVVSGEPRSERGSHSRAHTAWIERMLQSYSGAMATIKVNVCRFCGNTVLPKLSVALFKNSLIFFSTKDKVSQATPIACHADRPAEFE